MEPCAFDEENVMLDPPKCIAGDSCQSITVWMGNTNLGAPVTVSCWKITKEELEELQRTGRLWLIILGHNMPPVHLTTVKPVKPHKEEGE